MREIYTYRGGPGMIAWAGPLRRLFVSQPDYSALVVITDTSHVGVLERGTALGGRAGASVVRGVLFLPAHGEGRMASSELLDITGRRVLVLKPGPNDVRGFADGVYFVMEQSAFSRQYSGTENGARSTVHVRKVIIQH